MLQLFGIYFWKQWSYFIHLSNMYQKPNNNIKTNIRFRNHVNWKCCSMVVFSGKTDKPTICMCNHGECLNILSFSPEWMTCNYWVSKAGWHSYLKLMPPFICAALLYCGSFDIAIRFFLSANKTVYSYHWLIWTSR